MKKKYMTSANYDLFSFRITEYEKVSLQERLDRILDHQRENLESMDRSPKKYDLILQALDIGLTQIEKELKISTPQPRK